MIFRAQKFLKASVFIGFFVFIVLSTVSIDFKESFDSLFFARAMRFQQSVYNATILEYGNQISEYELIIEYNNELEWAMEGQKFFDVYLNKKVNFHMVPKEEMLDLYQNIPEYNNTKVFILNGFDVLEITE